MRQKRRSFLMVAVVTFGFAAFALAGGFIAQSFEGLKEGTIHSVGDLQVVDRRAVGKAEEATLEYGLPDAARARALAAGDPEVASVLPRINFVGLATTGSKMSVEELQASITTHVPVSSGLISLVVSASDPDEAAQLANAIAAELKNYTSASVTEPTASNIKLTVIDPAIPSERPAGPRVLFTAAIGAAIGLVLSVSLAFLIESVRRPETEAGVEADA